ncbi:transglycosylase SLT domain-containing protein [Ramlibacter sp.]|uniref:transglycosylase SLT domain-containing protein n=1 Tax=Ramlibacter sp. TaxID=1917967 RepID=UPI00261E9448|nr:transglycosylase SLT domain-containing protein [Ramlibacter sp.]MDB5956733.1 Mannosyl-glycoprotein endo-beta-N-acetylglucosamidase [Ramlibacter sp.]
MDGLDDFSSDVLSAAAGGKPKQAAASLVTPQLLDGLRHVESSGDPHAVNPQTGAMGPYQFMPGTVAMLHKQGVKFDPFDEEQSRNAAATYLGQLVEKNGGDVRKALGQYGGFVTKDPSPYVDKVLAASGHAPSAASHSTSDGLEDFSSHALTDAATQATKSTARPFQAAGPAQPAGQTITSSAADLTAHIASSLAAPIVGGYAGIASGVKNAIQTGSIDKGLAAGADAAAKTQDALTYQPRTGQGKEMVEGFDSAYNPLTWIPSATQWAGDKLGDLLAEHGAPGAGAITRGVGAAAPVALGLTRPLSSLLKPGETPSVTPRIEPTMDTAAVIARPRQEQPPTTIPAPGEPAPVIPQPMPQQAAPVQATPGAIPPAPRPMGATAPAAAPPQAPQPPYTPFPAPAAVKVPTPVPSTPQAVQAMASTAPAELFPETPTVAPEGRFGAQEQAARAKVLESVGIDTQNLRKSALAGDGIGGSTDYQTSKVDSSAGRHMKAIIDGERQALSNNSDSLIQRTGGTNGIDEPARHARGSTIVSSLDSLKDWYDSRTQQLYRVADDRSQGVPTTLERFRSMLGEDSEMTNSDRVHLRDAINSYAKKLGMVGEDGKVFSNAQQAETMRKYLNENWSPSNGRYVGKLKDALDSDIMEAAGEDVYGEARAMRAQRGATLDNPNGIAKLMDSSGPNGINRAVPVEKIPYVVTGMPVDQFTHVVNTLRNAPPEVLPQTTAALNEIKAQFANEVKAVGTAHAGQWNARGVTKYLQDHAARMAQVFTPEEIGAFRNLNDAGHIVAKDQSYPGAAVQGHNLVTQGVMHSLPSAGAGAGAALFGPVGAVAGGAAGKLAAGALDNATALRAVKKRTTKLSDLLTTR